MQVALEIPTSIIKQIRPLTDYDFALAQLVLTDKKYAKAYANRGNRFLILDNGADELGNPVSAEDLLRAAKLVNPDIVVVPDASNNVITTINNFREFLKRDVPYKLMGAVQGKTIDECMSCVIEFFTSDKLDRIGIPFDIMCERSDPLVKLSSYRREVVAAISKLGCPIHLLGVSLPEELKAYKDLELVRSVDTGTPILYALRGTKFGSGVSYSKATPTSVQTFDYNIKTLSKEQFNIIQYNITYLKRCAGGKI